MKDQADSVTGELLPVGGSRSALRMAARRERLAALGVKSVTVFVREQDYRRGREDGASGVNPGEFPAGVDPLSYLAGWQNAVDFGGRRLIADGGFGASEDVSPPARAAGDGGLSGALGA